MFNLSHAIRYPVIHHHTILTPPTPPATPPTHPTHPTRHPPTPSTPDPMHRDTTSSSAHPPPQRQPPPLPPPRHPSSSFWARPTATTAVATTAVAEVITAVAEITVVAGVITMVSTAVGAVAARARTPVFPGPRWATEPVGTEGTCPPGRVRCRFCRVRPRFSRLPRPWAWRRWPRRWPPLRWVPPRWRIRTGTRWGRVWCRRGRGMSRRRRWWWSRRLCRIGWMVWRESLWVKKWIIARICAVLRRRTRWWPQGMAIKWSSKVTKQNLGLLILLCARLVFVDN